MKAELGWCGPEAGAAVVTSLVFLALVGVVAAALTVAARFRLMQAAAVANGARAYYAAEAGLAAALAGFPAGLAYTRSLAGPDGVQGTGDDGALPYAELVAEVLSVAAAKLDLFVEDDQDEEPTDPAIDTNERVVVRVLGRGEGEARRILYAVVGRAGQPYDPAAIFLAAGTAALDGSSSIDGSDYHLADGCESPSGAPARAGLAMTDGIALRDLRERLLLSGAERVVGEGGAASLALARPVDMGYLSEVVGGAAIESSAGVVEGTWGEAQSPASGVIRGDALVEGLLRGYGALVVTGDLVVSGAVDFRGSLIVGGHLRVAPTGALSVCGAIWSGGALANEGTLMVRHSSEALALADTQMRLARLPKLLAVREEF